MSTKLVPKLFLIYDNRIVPPANFQVEAASIAYHRFMKDFIEKLVFINQYHFQNLMIGGIGIAASPSTIKIITPNEFSTLSLHLEPKFSSLGGNLAPSQSWSGIFADAMRKILVVNQIQPSQSPYETRHAMSETIIMFYSTDLNMIGPESSGSISEGLKQFMQAFHLTYSALRSIRIKFAAIELMDEMYCRPREANKFALHSEIFSKHKYAQFQNLPNSSIVFDEEIKIVCGICSPKYCITLELPPCHNIKLDVKLQLAPATLEALQDIPYISSLESCGILQSNMVDASYLAGHSVKICCLEDQFKFYFQIDDQSFHNNRILLDSIRDWLLANNLVLLIRAPFEHVGSLESCYKYWILVPERKESESKLVMIMLADRDDILEQNNKLTSALQGISKDSKSLEESQTYDEYMQFLDESKEFWGDPTPYNPWIYSSGLFNAKFMEYSMQKKSQVITQNKQYPMNKTTTNIIYDNPNKSTNKASTASTNSGRGGGRAGGKDIGGGRGGRGGRGSKNTPIAVSSPMNIQPKVSLPAVIDLSDDSSSRSKGHEDLNRDQERIENVNKANEIEQKSRSKFLRRKYSDVKLSSESWIDEDELYNP